MRILEHTQLLPYSIDACWEVISCIERYPEFVPFLTQTNLIGPLQENAIWYDVTLILWIPIKMKHKMTEVEKKRIFAFKVFVPFGGTMTQTFELKSKQSMTEIKGTIAFDLGNPLVDRFVGPILEKRLNRMLQGMFQNALKVIDPQE